MTNNFTIDGNYMIPENDFEVTFFARGSHYHDNGRMYMPNGDPGYPPEDEINIDYIEITSIKDDSDEEVLSKYSKEEIDALENVISDKIYSGDYEYNYYEPDYEEPDEY